MPSLYLSPADYQTYGVPGTTTQPQVWQASTLIDAYLMRPEGLVYNPDYLGLPCYMAALEPEMTWNSAGAIAPGNSVVVNLTTQVQAFDDMIGEVVILDRGTQSLTEACVISAVATGQVTLSSVANNHSSNCTLDFGLTIFEEVDLPEKRSIATVMRPPLRLLSGLGRYGYGRRTDQVMGMFNEVNLLAAIQSFGGPPMWVPFPPVQASLSLKTREIWIPAGILMAYYSEVRLRYVSGYQAKSIPPVIKMATAQLLNAINQQPELTAQLSSIEAGSTTIKRFAPSQLDRDTLQMINNYRCVLVR